MKDKEISFNFKSLEVCYAHFINVVDIEILTYFLNIHLKYIELYFESFASFLLEFIMSIKGTKFIVLEAQL